MKATYRHSLSRVHNGRSIGNQHSAGIWRVSEAETPNGTDGPRQATMTVGEAAKRLQLTPDAIRGRLQRGTLEGAKRDGEWQISMPAVDYDRPGPDIDGDVGDAPSRPVDGPSLAAVVDRLIPVGMKRWQRRQDSSRHETNPSRKRQGISKNSCRHVAAVAVQGD